MSYWIFKISRNSIYLDIPGEEYAYDNTHSVRVAAGDEFLYLEKAGAIYAISGAGRVSRVLDRRALPAEQRSPKVTRIFRARLSDVVWFSPPYDLSSQRKGGLANRRRVGLPEDLNSIGWSISIPSIDRDLFRRLLDAAIDISPPEQPTVDNSSSWYVDDAWSIVRKRYRLGAFRRAVLSRQGHVCLVCGTRVRSTLEIAHIRSYASDPHQRANPANGICLCRFCHSCFDADEIRVLSDGSLLVTCKDDAIAKAHFYAVDTQTRRLWLAGVDLQLLEERNSKSPSSVDNGGTLQKSTLT